MSSDDYVETEGEVVDTYPNAVFSVLLDPPLDQDGPRRFGISGKIRKNNITIIPGDRVKVAISIVDPTQGRITFRMRKK